MPAHPGARCIIEFFTFPGRYMNHLFATKSLSGIRICVPRLCNILDYCSNAGNSPIRVSKGLVLHQDLHHGAVFSPPGSPI